MRERIGRFLKSAARLCVDAARDLRRGWFQMTLSEQRALLTVLTLFALGLLVRWWRHRP